MGQINCRYCNNEIQYKIKLSAADIGDDYAGQLDNLQGGTQSDKCYRKEIDPLDWPLYYLDKETKKYPGKKDVVPPEDDQGSDDVSTASVVNNFLIVKCASCGNTYAEVQDPSSNSTYNNDNYRNNPETAPVGYPNTIHEDFNKVVPSTDVNVDKVVNKIKNKKILHFKNEK